MFINYSMGASCVVKTDPSDRVGVIKRKLLPVIYKCGSGEKLNPCPQNTMQYNHTFNQK